MPGRWFGCKCEDQDLDPQNPHKCWVGTPACKRRGRGFLTTNGLAVFAYLGSLSTEDNSQERLQTRASSLHRQVHTHLPHTFASTHACPRMCKNKQTTTNWITWEIPFSLCRWAAAQVVTAKGTHCFDLILRPLGATITALNPPNGDMQCFVAFNLIKHIPAE